MVQILDTTLREGEQTPKVAFPPYAKLEIAEYIDKVGIDIIETGHPLVDKDIYRAVKQIANNNFNATIAAHSRAAKVDVDGALECGVDFIGIFYCVSDGRLEDVFNKALNDAVGRITETIKYCKEQKPDIIIRYTPEDTVRSNKDNVVTAAVEACRAGADIISIADTTGHMIPGIRSMYDYVKWLREELAKKNVNPKIAVHCHNDRGLALANVLDAYRAGVDIIDVSVNSLGERTGIVDLATLLAVLNQDFNEKNNWNLKEVKNLYERVAHYSRIPIAVNQPVMGENAFRHCSGVHAHAVRKGVFHYEDLHPEPFGLKAEIVLDHMAGKDSVKGALEIAGIECDDSLVCDVLKVVKKRGKTGNIVDIKELKYLVDWCKNGGN